MTYEIVLKNAVGNEIAKRTVDAAEKTNAAAFECINEVPYLEDGDTLTVTVIDE